MGMRMGRNETEVSNRADEVRKRRSERSQQRASTVNNRVVNPVNFRPVIVRGNNFGTPIHRQAGTRARRQFYVTMDQALGAELRLPALPFVNPGWRILSALLLALAGLGLFSLWNSPFFRVQSVTVQGLERLSAEELTDTLSLENLSIIEIAPEAVQAEVTKAYPELTDVRVTVELPNFVNISAAERQPVMAWQQDDDVLWIDAEGVYFPVRGEAGPLLTIHTEDDLPLAPLPADAIEEEETEESQASDAAKDPLKAKEQEVQRRADPALLAAAQSLSQKLPPETTIVYDNENGLGWVDAQGWQVYIGTNLGDFEAKYDMYQKLAGYLFDKGIQPKLVSVAQLSAPFYRLEQ